MSDSLREGQQNKSLPITSRFFQGYLFLFLCINNLGVWRDWAAHFERWLCFHPVQNWGIITVWLLQTEGLVSRHVWLLHVSWMAPPSMASTSGLLQEKRKHLRYINTKLQLRSGRSILFVDDLFHETLTGWRWTAFGPGHEKVPSWETRGLYSYQQITLSYILYSDFICFFSFNWL